MTEEPPEKPKPELTVKVQQLPPEVFAHVVGSTLGTLPGGGIQLALPNVIEERSHSWNGPYPPPEAVERYEKVLPGTLNRLISMAEQLQAAQIDQSNTSLQMTQRDTRRGHLLGFATTALAMIGALVALWLGYPWVAGAFLSVPVMAVAKALVETTRSTSGPSSTDSQQS